YSAIGEEPVELEQPRIGEQRPRGCKRDLGPLQAEGVFEHGASVEEDVAPATHTRKRVAATSGMERRPSLAQTGDTLDEHKRGRTHTRVALEPQLDLDVAALDSLLRAELAAQAHRPLREPDPQPGGHR